MKAYLVRERGKKILHGIFWAQNLGALWDTVDEMGDPSDFEYRQPLGSGGMWHNIPIGEIETESWADEIEGCEEEKPASVSLDTMSELMCETMDTEDGWKRFDFTNVGHGMLARIRRDIAKRNA